MKPTWAFEAGHIARVDNEGVAVADEDGETLVLDPGALLLTCGWGSFVLMETGLSFRVDELDALIIEHAAELLISR